ncbi:MAG: FkbM family methyltransferase [Flavobacteriaceae bacterium]|nr:FkbM family methyltransferase [Flavobacteriaceae bacterium]
MNLTNLIRKIINPIKIDVVRYPNSDLTRRIKLFKYFGINKVLDVGANKGQYAKLIRKIGFKGNIVSFEPLSEAYKILEKSSIKDKKWEIHNFALGDKEETSIINVSENLFSSSLLDMTSSHVESAPTSNYKSTEKISVKTLNQVFNDVVDEKEVVFLKLDVQGFEENVLKGASNILSKIKGIQIEMSLLELYEGEMLYRDIINLLESYGFELFSLENGFQNKDSGRLLQVDGIFFRN